MKIAASGGNGSEPPTGFRAGDLLMCRVLESEPGGYSVTVLKGDLPGFIQTTSDMEPGVDVACRFVCMYRGKALVKPVFEKPSVS